MMQEMEKVRATVRETVPLIRNRVYTTYQFHGILGRDRDPEQVFKTALSEIFQWLRDRFRLHEQIPEQIILPEDPAKISFDQLVSFRIDSGYIIETVWIPEQMLWAFQITEPDMGNSNREPVPGRVFLTDYGLHLSHTGVEFGTRTTCSEPENTEKEAEVFRPKVIRDLKERLGFFNAIDLEYDAISLTEPSGAKKFHALLDSEHRNMPIVVLEFKNPVLALIPDPLFRNQWDTPLIQPSRLDFAMPSPLRETPVPVPTPALTPGAIREAANLWGKALFGFSPVFINDQGSQNLIRILYPGRGAIEYPLAPIDGEGVLEQLKQLQVRIHDLIKSYPKRNESFQFGQVKFLGEVHQIQQAQELERLMSANDKTSQIQALTKTVQDLEGMLRREEQKSREFAEKLHSEKILNSTANHTLTVAKNQRQAIIDEQTIELQKLSREIASLREENTVLRSRLKRPSTVQGFLNWVEENFGEQVLLLSRARDELKKEQNPDLQLFCDAIEVLALDYRQFLLGKISMEELNEHRKNRDAAALEIAPSGDASIKRFAEDYKVPYQGHGCDGNGRRTLDRHLKYGVESQHLLRIYFFWDDSIQKVVIGSMPKHLRIVT